MWLQDWYRTGKNHSLILYQEGLPDHIVQGKTTLNHIVHGLRCEEGRKKKQCSPMYLRSKMKSNQIVTMAFFTLNRASNFSFFSWCWLSSFFKPFQRVARGEFKPIVFEGEGVSERAQFIFFSTTCILSLLYIPEPLKVNSYIAIWFMHGNMGSILHAMDVTVTTTIHLT